jgi:hypothetical protein
LLQLLDFVLSRYDAQSIIITYHLYAGYITTTTTTTTTAAAAPAAAAAAATTTTTAAAAAAAATVVLGQDRWLKCRTILPLEKKFARRERPGVK